MNADEDMSGKTVVKGSGAEVAAATGIALPFGPPADIQALMVEYGAKTMAELVRAQAKTIVNLKSELHHKE